MTCKSWTKGSAADARRAKMCEGCVQKQLADRHAVLVEQLKRLRGYLRQMKGPVEEYVESTASCGEEMEETRLLRTLNRQIQDALGGEKPPRREKKKSP